MIKSISCNSEEFALRLYRICYREHDNSQMIPPLLPMPSACLFTKSDKNTKYPLTSVLPEINLLLYFPIFPVTSVLQFSFFAPFADESVGCAVVEADLCRGVLVGFAVEILRKCREEVFVQSVACGAFGCGSGLRGGLRQVEEDFCVVAYEREGYGSGGGVVAVETYGGCLRSCRFPVCGGRRVSSLCGM